MAVKKEADIQAIKDEFSDLFNPLETGESLVLFTDRRTGARFCECHIKGSILVKLGTTDAPLDPEEQPDYKANRDIRLNSPAFSRMKDDAKSGRTFSNIVAEYTTDFDEGHPLKIVGGQHRFKAIEEAVAGGVDETHGIKVYFNLDTAQRMDVQLISNTNIAISSDLFDRMQETSQGPQLRDWCQAVGLLEKGQDFADQYVRGGPIAVRMARSFITNYFLGKQLDDKKFDSSDTTPVICPSGDHDADWEALKAAEPKLWEDEKLIEAGKEFAQLVAAQRGAFIGKKSKADYPDKALSPAVYSAWAYAAGALNKNLQRLKRHYALRNTTGKDPLAAEVLARGRHKTDSDTYRGLGYRSDAKERGRFVELFWLQAEKGDGISKGSVDVAIAKYHAKQALLEVEALEGKLNV